MIHKKACSFFRFRRTHRLLREDNTSGLDGASMCTCVLLAPLSVYTFSVVQSLYERERTGQNQRPRLSLLTSVHRPALQLPDALFSLAICSYTFLLYVLVFCVAQAQQGHTFTSSKRARTPNNNLPRLSPASSYLICPSSSVRRKALAYSQPRCRHAANQSHGCASPNLDRCHAPRHSRSTWRHRVGRKEGQASEKPWHWTRRSIALPPIASPNVVIRFTLPANLGTSSLDRR